MKFAVETLTKNSGRIGSLTIDAHFKVKTPLVLHYTKVANVPHIGREAFDMITEGKQGISISIETTSLMADALKVFQKGIASFAGLDHTFSLVTLKDSGHTNPSYYNRDSVAILTRSGKETITPEKYMDLIESFKPDFFHVLCDGDTPESCGNKRIFNAVNRTECFFNQCVERYKASPSLVSSTLIASIEGGYDLTYRENTIKFINTHHNQDVIGGYFLDGFHSNGSNASVLNNDKVCEIVKRCIELLPQNKFKVMLGAYSPQLVLQLVQLGIDLFDSTFAYLATMENRALTFNFNICREISDDNLFDLDLTDSIYKNQFRPFSEHCTCLTCKNHTRAYVQHLINTKELLGPILLMIHNTHHYLEFFEAIRQNIGNEDNFSKLLEIISEQQKKFNSIMDERQKNHEMAVLSDKSNANTFKKPKYDDSEVAAEM